LKFFDKIGKIKYDPRTMDSFQQIYAHQADAYHRMIDREDVDGRLMDALTAVCSFDGRRILDIGTGTGRIPILLRGTGAKVLGIDFARDMLRQNALLRGYGLDQWDLAQADMRHLPVPNGWAEVVTAGWAIGHFTGWYPARWREEIAAVLGEMEQAACRGGTLVILETLSTGATQPAPPNSELAAYYRLLEADWGYHRDTIATDYQFENVEQAVEYTEFFFGSELSAKIRANGWARLPEWTGIWSKQRS
jgi:ubiquinone/menaquinone biosynthesis C-methylase UbiE